VRRGSGDRRDDACAEIEYNAGEVVVIHIPLPVRVAIGWQGARPSAKPN
jgi:hypothetical protein